MQFYKSNSGDLPIWNTQDAKARFSQLVHSATEQDQLITNRDTPIVVVMSKKRYDKLTRKRGTFLDFFKKAPLPNIDLHLKREKDIPRDLEL